MAQITNTEAALLGLLAEGDKHPYQIEKEVEQRSMRYWTDLSMSSIYKLLRKLEKSGLVTHKTELSEENRARKIYSLTPSGLKTLKLKVKVLISSPEHLKWQMDIGVSNLGLLDKSEIKPALNQYKNQLNERLHGYMALLKYLENNNCEKHRMALAKRPIHLIKGELEWLEEYAREF